MPPWFIDIESATEMEAESNGKPPASRTAAQAWRARSPSGALQGVTRPSVEATPTKGCLRSASLSPSACRKARCGARSRPSTVARDGRIGKIFLVLIDDLCNVRAVAEAELDGAPRGDGLRHAVHDLLQRRIGIEAHLAGAACGVAHLLRRDRDAVQENGSLRAEPLRRQLMGMEERFHDPAEGNTRHPRVGPHWADVVASRERLADDGARPARNRGVG